jgi:type II secretory pathway pseudopilin PulG
MNLAPANPNARADRRHQAGFTLAEVLAAMLFMAIVIPVAIMGLRLASQTGQVATRKAVAARIGERVLNEMIVTGQTQKSAQSGVTRESGQDFRWNLTIEPSGLDLVRLATVQVFYPVQGRDYDVRLSTLVNLQ